MFYYSQAKQTHRQCLVFAWQPFSIAIQQNKMQVHFLVLDQLLRPFIRILCIAQTLVWPTNLLPRRIWRWYKLVVYEGDLQTSYHLALCCSSLNDSIWIHASSIRSEMDRQVNKKTTEKVEKTRTTSNMKQRVLVAAVERKFQSFQTIQSNNHKLSWN
jgi:hypothetical protein